VLATNTHANTPQPFQPKAFVAFDNYVPLRAENRKPSYYPCHMWQKERQLARVPALVGLSFN